MHISGVMSWFYQKKRDLSSGTPFLSLKMFFLSELGGGAMYDIGMYTAQLALMVFGDDFPQSISASGHLTSEGLSLLDFYKWMKFNWT